MLYQRWLLCIPALTLLLGLPSTLVAQGKKSTPITVGDAELLTWVDAKVKERMPTAEERVFDDVGWARDIGEALALAKKHNRPVFLFTHDGKMNLGRC
jgi:hypothetical protein